MHKFTRTSNGHEVKEKYLRTNLLYTSFGGAESTSASENIETLVRSAVHNYRKQTMQCIQLS